jgi:hypothetical protein
MSKREREFTEEGVEERSKRRRTYRRKERKGREIGTKEKKAS